MDGKRPPARQEDAPETRGPHGGLAGGISQEERGWKWLAGWEDQLTRTSGDEHGTAAVSWERPGGQDKEA